MIAPPVSQVFLRLLDFFPCEQSYVAKLCQYVRIISKYFHYRKSWTYTYLRMTIYPIDFKAVSFLNIYQTQKNINPDSTELRRDHWTSASNDFESQPECPAVLVVRREGLIRALTFAPIILLNTFNLHGWVGKEGLWACRPSVGAGQATVRC